MQDGKCSTVKANGGMPASIVVHIAQMCCMDALNPKLLKRMYAYAWQWFAFACEGKGVNTIALYFSVQSDRVGIRRPAACD